MSIKLKKSLKIRENLLYYKQGGCFALKKFIINGGKTLSGTIHVSGAKNSAVALLPAAILCDEVVNIYNVPNISDTYALIDILKLLNVQTEYKNDEIMIDPRNLENRLIDEELCSKLRGSYYFMGALLGKNKKVERNIIKHVNICNSRLTFIFP